MPDPEVTTIIPAEPAAAAPDPAAKPAPAAAPAAKPDPAAAPDPAAKPPEPTKVGEAKAPVEYKFTAPEGVKLDEAKLGAFTEKVKAAGLDPKVAQEILDLGVSELQAATAANAKAWTDLQDQWKSELEKDPELGGTKGAAAQAVIGRALDAYGSKEARAAFDLTGAGNNPHVAKFIYAMAKALDEGGPVPTGGVPGKNKTLGERFYGGNN